MEDNTEKTNIEIEKEKMMKIQEIKKEYFEMPKARLQPYEENKDNKKPVISSALSNFF